MARRGIWLAVGVFVLAMLVSVEPADRQMALSDISLGGSQALAKKGGSGPDLPSIFDTIDDLDLLSDDDGPDDDGPDDGVDDDDGPDDDGPDDGKDD